MRTRKERNVDKENKNWGIEEGIEKKSDINGQRERLGAIQDRLRNLKRSFI